MKRMAYGAMVIGLLLAGCGDEQVQSTNTASNQATQQSQTKESPKDAKAIIDALKKSGLPIGKVEVYTAETDPNKLLGRPGQYVSKANFVDARAKEPVSQDVDITNGGSIEVFANNEDAKRRFDYVSQIAKGGGPFSEYDYLNGNVLLRVSHELTPDQEKEYEQKLADVLK